MKHSTRSALVSAGGLLLIAASLSVPALASEAISPRQAIERAARERIGEGVLHVDVDTVTTTVEAQPMLVAVPDPSGAVGRSMRFSLTVNGQRRGTAVAAVRVRARVVRSTRPIERNEVIEESAVTVVDEQLDGARFGRLPGVEDIVGARARRAIDPGVLMISGMVDTPAAVVNGDRVTVGVTIGPVHVTGEGIASGSGHVGEIVHVLRPGQRGLLRARVVERGVVEVLP